MDLIEKARIRLEHWISHNTHHIEEYKEFAKELKEAGKLESAKHIENMVDLAMKSNESLRNALRALEE